AAMLRRDRHAFDPRRHTERAAPRAAARRPRGHGRRLPRRPGPARTHAGRDARGPGRGLHAGAAAARLTGDPASAQPADRSRAARGLPQATRDEARAVRAVFFPLGQLPHVLPATPYLRRLQNNPARRHDPRPETLGPARRSASMPAIDRTLPNDGFPEGQLPVTSCQRAAEPDLPRVGWGEVRRHCHAHDLWVVVRGEVYDLTAWAADHPGGLPILLRYAGGDATAAFDAAGHADATR